MSTSLSDGDSPGEAPYLIIHQPYLCVCLCVLPSAAAGSLAAPLQPLIHGWFQQDFLFSQDHALLGVQWTFPFYCLQGSKISNSNTSTIASTVT